jgi:hypothetical protein
MSFYSEMAVMADELLREFGDVNEMLLVREIPIDSTSANPSPPIRREYPVKGVMKLRYLDTVESNSQVVEDKRELLLSVFKADGSALPIVPKSGDKMITQEEGQSVTWKVEAAAPVAPGGVAILYKLEISK